MLCFKDRTFCSAVACRNARCARRWTDQLQREADKWAKDSGLTDGAPIAFSDFSKECLGHFTAVTQNSFGDTVLLDRDEVVAVLNKPENYDAAVSENTKSSESI